MNFTKMHGLGNDFILIHQTQKPSFDECSALARKMCDRHTGAGADGLVVMYPSDQADLSMRIFNSDGSMAEQCGNAMRCVAKYYYEKISSRKNTFAIETKVGVQPVWTDGKNVRVDMGKPVLAPAEIPVRLSGEKAVNQTIEADGSHFGFRPCPWGILMR